MLIQKILKILEEYMLKTIIENIKSGGGIILMKMINSLNFYKKALKKFKDLFFLV